jgi:transposase
VTLQIVRDWVVRFNDRGPEGLLDGKAPGKPPLLNEVQRLALAEIVESGPIPSIHGVVRWRLIDLARWLHDEFGVSLTETTVARELKKQGYVKLTARPRHHSQNEYAMEDFKKGALPQSWQRSKSSSRATRRSRSGSRTKLALARKTRSPAAGPSAALGRRHRRIRGRNQPISLVPSAPNSAKGLA